MTEITPTAAEADEASSMVFTGERFVPEKTGNIELEHFHRYLAASEIVAGKEVLDIASGEGFGSEILSRSAARVIGVDIDHSAVAHANARYGNEKLSFIEGNAAEIPLADDSVDVAVSFETIEHHDRHEEMLKELRRVLRPGGVLVISSPEKYAYTDITGQVNRFHVKELYREEFVTLMRSYFPHVTFYGQRVVWGSLIMREDGASQDMSWSAETQKATRGLDQPLYLIAVASDEPLTLLPPSGLFEADVNTSDPLIIRDSEHRLEVEGYKYQLRSISNDNAILKDAAHEVIRMRASLYWKITRPVRFLRRLINRDYDQLRVLITMLPPPLPGLVRSARRFALTFPQRIIASKSNQAALNELAQASILNAGIIPSPMTALLLQEELPDVDISVVSYNSARWVCGFVESLAALAYPAERMHVRFVDNSSTDNTPALLEEAAIQLRAKGIDVQVLSRPNNGFGAGHNAGIAAGRSEFCLVTNLDLTFEPDALARVVSHARADTREAAAWEMRQKPYEHPKIYDPVSGTTTWNSHASVLLRRAHFEAAGGYCKDIFMYGEDVELSYRLRSAGHVLRFSPHAVVNHFSYEEPGEIKPIQFTGSTFANLYIRLAHGRLKDVMAVPIMMAGLLAAGERFPGARKASCENIGKLFLLSPKLLARNLTRAKRAALPFRGWDYEQIRAGAFYDSPPLQDERPLVSVVTRTMKGREAVLRQAMLTVANQTYRNIEHIISEDRGAELAGFVEGFAKQSGFNTRHVSGKGVGRSCAANHGLAAATGKYIVFLDDDDQFYCDHIEVLVAALQNDQTARGAYAVAFDVATRKEASDWSRYSVRDYVTHGFMTEGFDYEVMKVRNLFPIQVALFEKSLFDERGGFDEDLDQTEDWLFWQKMTYRANFRFVPKTTSFYRTPLDAAHFTERFNKLNEPYDAVRNRADAWRAEWDDTRHASDVFVESHEHTDASKINLLFPVGHFYSPIADPMDIARRYKQVFKPQRGCPGIDFRDSEQLELIKNLRPFVQDIPYTVEKAVDDETTYFYGNDQYPLLDAEFLYAALQHFKPARMIEVGSGFSSLLTADVNRRLLDNKLEFICVEPYPRQFLRDGVDGITKLVISKVEDLPIEFFDQLQENDVLFIDSSHVSKVGSDVNYLFFEVIPRLRPGVIVHVHDIFLPDEYPADWVLNQNRNWNEQYLLRAFLQFNSDFSVLWAAHYMGTRYRGAIQETFPQYPQRGGGGSFWIRRDR